MGTAPSSPFEIFDAIEDNDVNRVEEILNKFPNSNKVITRIDNMAQNSLSRAIYLHRTEIVEILLKNGANPNAIIESYRVFNYIFEEDLDILKILFKYGCNPNLLSENGYTMLDLKYTDRPDLDFIQLVIENGGYLHKSPKYDRQPFGFAPMLIQNNGIMEQEAQRWFCQQSIGLWRKCARGNYRGYF